MSDAIRDGVAEVLTGPATLLVYGLTAVGVVLALVSGQGSEAFDSYISLVDQLDVLLASLVGGRGLAAAAKGVGEGKVLAEKVKQSTAEAVVAPPQ